jgi:hypothetical protein
MATLVTNVGIAGIITKLNTTTPPRYVGWGTGGSVAPDPEDTTLETEAAEARTQGANTIEEGDVAGDTYQVVATIETLSDQTIDEVGLFSAESSGDMFVRGNFTGLSLLTGDAIQFTIKTKLGQPAA